MAILKPCSDCQFLDLYQNKASESENKIILSNLSHFLVVCSFSQVHHQHSISLPCNFCEQKSYLKT